LAKSVLFGTVVNNQNYALIDFGFMDNDPLSLNVVWSVGNVVQARLKTVGVFRDIGALFHIYLEVDTNNATAADRIRLYLNGSRVQALQNVTLPGLGAALPYMNTAVEHRFGNESYYGTFALDGQIAHPAFVDNQNPGVGAFGQFHPLTGQWRPKTKAQVKAVVDAGGATSTFPAFDDTTNTTTLCADASSKGNNWTATNISLTPGVTYDALTDTPTNVFPVLDANFANYGSVAGTITDGGLKFASSSTYHFTPCTIPLPSYGKWEAEFIPQDTVSIIGLADLDNGSGTAGYIGGGYGWYGSALYTGNAVAAQSGLATQAANDVITLAVDMDALTAKWFQNGVLRITQALSASKRYAFACGDYYAPGPTSCFANFGQRPLSYHQAGYSTLCSKNLRYPALPKSSAAFVAVTDTGANVQATLAAARPNWGAYIEIFKRRDSAEGWRWRFSDDPGNYLDSSSTAAKAAFPALSGSSYVGYALRVGSSNGIATGRLTHVNGVADTVTDGLGTTRKAIILKNEATGSWYFYHPDLTAGKLLYLEQTAGETTDATLGTVLTNSFAVAAALPSGTYRWVALGELDGFLRLFSDVGNGSTDGTIDAISLSPRLLMRKRVDSTGNSYLYDDARAPYNVANISLSMNSTSPDYNGGGNEVDLRSSGVKQRATGAEENAAGGRYVGLAVGAPFRYANAR
jgi:hypothetical protein